VQPTADPPTPALTGGDVDIRPGMALPLPDDAAAMAARERLSSIDVGVSAPTVVALGLLAEPVVFVAGVQGNAYPRPLLSTRVVLLTGSHAGGVVAGPTPDPRNAAPLQHMAINAGAGIVTLEWQPASAAIELEDAITPEQMDAAMRAGWAEAERAADEGIELIVVAAGGPGASTAAVAVIAAITGAEPPVLLPRVVTPAGWYDDNAWMTRCLTLRDALHRVRDRQGDSRTVLAALGGADIAAATGLLLGAAARRTPVMIDGPIGAAAALLANDIAPQTRRWIMMPDTGRHPAVRLAAGALELRPWLDLCLDLGEGCSCLTALPLLQTALTLAGAGEPVEEMPLTRYDSSGNQVFVGVAKPVEPEITPEAAGASTVETPPVPSEQPAAAAKAGAAKAGTPAPAKAGATAAAAKATEPAAAKAEAAKTEAPRPDAAAAKAGEPPAKAAPARAGTAAGKAAEPPAKAGAAKAPAKAAEPAKATGDKTPAKTAGPAGSRASSEHTVPIKIAAAKAPTKAAKAPAPAKAATPAAGRDVPAGKETPAKDAAPAAKAAPPKAAPAPRPAPKDTPAKDAAPKDAAPKDAAPKDAAPKDAAPKDAAPKDAAPKDPPVKDAPAKEPAAAPEPARKATDAANADGKDGKASADGAPESANGARPADPVGAAPAQSDPVAVPAQAGAPSASSPSGPPRPRKRS